VIKPTLERAVNEQINAELYSAYLYLAMRAWLERAGLPGMAHWMQIQFQEEMAHAERFYAYLLQRGGSVELRGVDGPPGAWDSPLAVFVETLAHERTVTARIDELATLALAERDHATHAFLQWFISEQVEEEATAEGLIQQLRRIGDSGQGALMLDREMAARVFTPPPPI